MYSELKRRNVMRVAIAYLAASWLLVQVVETMFPVFGLSDALIRLVAISLLIGFPLVLIVSWLYELTPEGLKLEKDVDPARSAVHHTGKKLDRVIIVVLTLALGYFAFDRFVLSESREASIAETARQEGRSSALVESYGDSSIAVLPFVNMSDDTSNEYFSDGISEELLNVLARIPNLRVISRSSSFSFKGKNIAIPDIAQQLNVAHVLEGSVRKHGNQVRITAQLIDARSDSHLWSETYDRELDGIFAIQDEISAAIAHALTENLGLELVAALQAGSTTNAEAHEAYLRGRYLLVQRRQTEIEGAVREFQKAITLDPDYALAHAELAITFLLLRSSNYGSLTEAEGIANATPHAEQALALDPKLAEAHAASGFVWWVLGNSEETLSHFEQAIEINPNYSIVYHWIGIHLSTDLGRYKEGDLMSEKALRLDPLSVPIRSSRLNKLVSQNKLAEAERDLQKLGSLRPSFYASGRGMMLPTGEWAGKALASLDALLVDPSRERLYPLSVLFAVLDLKQEALVIPKHPADPVLRILGKTGDEVTAAEAVVAENPDSIWLRHRLGLALAVAGDYERARPILEELWQQSGGRVTNASGLWPICAVALIALRQAAGDGDDIDELVAAIRDNGRRMREAGYVRACCWIDLNIDEGLAIYLAGERDNGLALIAKAVDDGVFVLPMAAYLQTLYNDPGFAPIRATQGARQASERKRFLAIVCSDNPYAAVWQPAEGTCERFAAAGGN